MIGSYFFRYDCYTGTLYKCFKFRFGTSRFSSESLIEFPRGKILVRQFVYRNDGVNFNFSVETDHDFAFFALSKLY